MAPKKKASRTGIYFFADEYRKSVAHQHHSMSIKQAIDLCHARFKALPPDQKLRYNQMAKHWNRQQRALNPGLNSIGAVIGTTNDVVDEMVHRQRVDSQVSECLVDRLLHNQDLDDLYLVNIQTFCTTIQGLHVPAELGICRIGSSSTFESSLINPGAIPTGCYGDAKESEDLHHIPADLAELANIEGVQNLSTAWVHLRTIMGRRARNGQPPPFDNPEDILHNSDGILFALSDNANVVRGVLKTLAEAANESCWFAVVSIESFFSVIYKRVYRAVLEGRLRKDELNFDTPPADFTLSHATQVLSYHHLSHTYCCTYHNLNATEHCTLIKVRVANRIVSQYYSKLMELAKN